MHSAFPAILWYYEKRLYAEMGARASPDVSYDEVARRIVQETTARVRSSAEDRGQNTGVGSGQDAAADQSGGADAGGGRSNEGGATQENAAQTLRGNDADTGQRVTNDATSEDLQGVIQGLDASIFAKDGWGIISANQHWDDNPFGPQRNARATSKMRADLETSGTVTALAVPWSDVVATGIQSNADVAALLRSNATWNSSPVISGARSSFNTSEASNLSP